MFEKLFYFLFFLLSFLNEFNVLNKISLNTFFFRSYSPLFDLFIVWKIVSPKIAPFDFGEEPLNFGEVASVQCTILGGDLPITVTWLLNNQSIEYMPDVSLSKIGKRIYVLSIESVAGHHAGNYSCRAKNVAGMSQHSAILTVNGLFLNQWNGFLFSILLFFF